MTPKGLNKILEDIYVHENKMADTSDIQKFFDGQRVLVTGGTGFMGKILVEKLLRSTDVATIYLLIRQKKGKNIHTRIDELFDDVIFARLKKERPKFKHRIVGIPGDCSITGLGLTIGDRQKLIGDTNVVFHVAATVRFHENIKSAYSINVSSTGDVIELCRQMKGLKSFVHVSTAYSNCHRSQINETFYDYQVNYENVGSLVQKLSKHEAEKLTPRIIGEWPNTYTFTKALAESLIKDLGGGLPVGIFRPAIILSTYKEPIPGWTDNLYGPTGACAAAAAGLLRVLYCDKNVVADVVPVDTCVAGLIACAWDVASKNGERTPTNIPIYNYVSSVENSITWGEYNTLNTLHDTDYPVTNSMWATTFRTTNDYRTYRFLKILLHILPGLLIDLVSVVCGKKPQMWTMYQKIHKFSTVIAFFSTRQWTFSNKNTVALWNKMNAADRELFPVSITTVPWLTYFRNYMKGIRIYLFRDPMDTLENAKTKKWRLRLAHNFVIFLIYFAAATFLWSLFHKATAIFTSNDVTSLNGMPRNDSCSFL